MYKICYVKYAIYNKFRQNMELQTNEERASKQTALENI